MPKQLRCFPTSPTCDVIDQRGEHCFLPKGGCAFLAFGNNDCSGTSVLQFFGPVGPCPAYGAFFVGHDLGPHYLLV